MQAVATTRTGIGVGIGVLRRQSMSRTLDGNEKSTLIAGILKAHRESTYFKPPNIELTSLNRSEQSVGRQTTLQRCCPRVEVAVQTTEQRDRCPNQQPPPRW
jgi:hypothetical protein